MAEITYEWSNVITFTPGLTPDGSYDTDVLYQTDIVKTTKLFGFQLGYPMVNVELHYTQVFTNFENAIEQYTALVNEYNIVDNMNNVIGTDKTTDDGAFTGTKFLFSTGNNAVVSAGSSKTFELKATVANAATDDYLTVKITEDAASLSDAVNKETRANALLDANQVFRAVLDMLGME
jgi:hypothetical protein